MKIKLNYPYSEDYVAGYVNINKEPRRVLVLVSSDGTKTSTSYARYLMSCNEKRYLSLTEHVDHKDGDKMNDVISNLQILTPQENNIKKVKELGLSSKPITLMCPICKNEFTRPRRNLITKLNKGKTPTCSRKCGGKWSHKQS